MPRKSTVEICRRDLFANKDELEARYDLETVNRVLRLRDMYLWKIGYPESTDRKFAEEVQARYGIGHSQAYSDLSIIKQLIPLITSSSRDYHRWRTNEMLIASYNMAKERQDTRTMAMVAAQYGKLNRVDLEDEQLMPYEMIVPQSFTATSDPTVLGIKPIPNIQKKIDEMIAKYRAESMDIEDVDYEDVDLEEDELWGNPEEDGEERIV